ncbi:MAG: phage holin family protein [Eubacterium sp.]
MREAFQWAAVLGGGTLSYVFGGLDDLLKALLLLIILDYITGVIVGASRKNLSSAIGLRGIFKKLMILFTVSAAYAIQQVIAIDLPIRDMTVLFYLCNEGISLLENASELIPVPQKLKEILLKFKEEEEKK